MTLSTQIQSIQSIQSMGGVDDLFALRFSIQSIQSVGGVDDLFALRFTAFRAFKVWGCR